MPQVRTTLIRILCATFACVGQAQAMEQPEAEPENIARSVEEANELKAEKEKAIANANQRPLEPASVRVGLRLTNFQKLVTISEGKRLVRYQPLKELSHMLRARLGRKNHFFVDQYHIETKPMLWKKDTGEYALRLQVYRRYGAFGQLEESIGHVDVRGVLGDRQGNVFVLYGAARKRFRDKFGNPVLDLVAGFKPAPKERAMPPQASSEQAPAKVRRAPRKTAMPKLPNQFRKRF